MPRPPRIIVPGGIYHVLNRGNGRQALFRKPADFAAFVAILAEALQRVGDVELLCWCLMSNHWHLVARVRGGARSGDPLQRFMQWLSITHVRRHHRHHTEAARHTAERSARRAGERGLGTVSATRGVTAVAERTGHLYQGRYKHFAVEEDTYFLMLCRYVEANALRAGLVRRAEDWPWSSLHQRMSRDPKVKQQLPVNDDDWPIDRPANWVALVNEAMPSKQSERVRQSIARDRPLGGDAWVKRVARRSGLEQTLRERGRPRKPIHQLSTRQRRRREREGERET
jgi:putative transposase